MRRHERFNGLEAQGKLLEAAISGDLEMIKEVAARNGALEFCWLIGSEWPMRGAHRGMASSVLFVAVQAGHLQVVRTLIRHLDLKKYKWFQELVQWAVRWGHASIVEFLVNECQRLLGGVRADEIMGLTLHLAAHHGHLKVLHLKVLQTMIRKCSTCPEKKKSYLWKDGMTPLHLAAQSGFVSAVELLIEIAKMDVSAVSDPERFTPLHLAANFGHVQVVDFFLTLNNIEQMLMARDCLGRTALHYAAREGHADVVQALVNACQGIALVRDYDGMLALHMAARAGHVKVIKELYPYGGIMCKAKHSLAVKSWFQREYNTKAEDIECSLTFSPGKKWISPRVKLWDSLFWRTEGFTPLHFAARYGYGAAVEELLKSNNIDLSQNLGDARNALFIQDSGGFVAYDWMVVLEQANAFLGSCVANGCNLDVNAMKEELQKRGVGSKITKELSKGLASDILEEKQAIQELQRAWQSANRIEHIWMPALQWLLEDEEEVDVAVAWRHELPLSLKPYDFHMLDQALKKDSFTAAKHILLHYSGADLSLDAVRVSRSVKETLTSLTDRGMDELDLSFKRSMEDFFIVLVTRKELGPSLDANWLVQWVDCNKFPNLLGVLLNRPELKRTLYEDRQLYVDCANAILVGAALIAGVAFQGWLQPPLGYSYEYQGAEYADVHESAVRAFWWFNNGSFFFAMVALIAGAKGAVPVRRLSIDFLRSLEKVRRAVGVASFFLGMALVCVVGAFSAAGLAVLPPLASDLQIMQTCVGLGSTLCALALLWFSLSVWPLVKETIRYMAPKPGILVKNFIGVVCFVPCVLFVWVQSPTQLRMGGAAGILNVAPFINPLCCMLAGIGATRGSDRRSKLTAGGN